ncbi:MAG: phenylalanine--tRNA ligase beta subunit-related protein [Deltaproteobacteria bacterium]|jgi:DNA/RNA-binding domain of Phe-tRNA-synthetase-like protein
MKDPVQFSKSSRYTDTYGALAFGLTLISGCTNGENPPGFDQFKRKRLRWMRKRERLAEITERIDVYDGFFTRFGHECPLPGHLKRTVNSGFPRYNLMVDAHFMAEMCAGILVAVTDYDRFDGGLTLDVADAGEMCKGMGGREMVTRDGEIVLRDEKEIVCVLCQGADEKTRVSEETSNVLFYGYCVPGIEAQYVEAGLRVAADAMTEFGNGTLECLAVYE